MNICAAIPARMASERLPMKMIMKIDGRTVIQRTVDQVLRSKIKAVYLFRDSPAIEAEGATVVDTLHLYPNGTARISANLAAVPECFSHILVVLGDQPLLNPLHIGTLINMSHDEKIINALYTVADAKNDRTTGKIVLNSNDEAIHISRHDISPYQHVSMVLFPRHILEIYNKLSTPIYQEMESNEWLKLLYYQFKMKAFFVGNVERDVNTLDDLKIIKGKIKRGSL